MAENLRRLVSNESLRLLQGKLETWAKEYNVSRAGRPPPLALPRFPAKVVGVACGGGFANTRCL